MSLPAPPASATPAVPPLLLLLKAPSAPPTADKYTLYFHDTLQGPTPVFIPPLDSTTPAAAAAQLRAHFHDRAAFRQQYSGLILTSQRAVATLDDALAASSASDDAHAPELPIYVVGPATAAATTTTCATHRFRASIRGASSGHSAALAGCIRADPVPSLPLLYLVGETHDPLFAASLAPVPVEELVVYATHVRPTFGAELRRALDGMETRHSEAGTMLWIVVFAPTGLAALWDAFGEDKGEEAGRAVLETRRKAGHVRVAAIGPKTETVAARRGFVFDAVAARPTPEGLWAAIREGGVEGRTQNANE